MAPLTLILVFLVFAVWPRRGTPPAVEQERLVPTLSAEERAEGAKEVTKFAEARKAEEAEYAKTKAGKIWSKHTEWSREVCEVIAAGKIRIGMTTEQVRVSWGRPESINTTVYASGTHEQWVYGVGQYVYFNNGIMTSLQQSK